MFGDSRFMSFEKGNVLRYLLAIIVLPVAVLLCAKPITHVRMKKHTKAVTAAIREPR